MIYPELLHAIMPHWDKNKDTFHTPNGKWDEVTHGWLNEALLLTTAQGRNWDKMMFAQMITFPTEGKEGQLAKFPAMKLSSALKFFVE